MTSLGDFNRLRASRPTITAIVTEVAIFQFSEQHDLAASQDNRGSRIEGGKNRVRPIAMTMSMAIRASQ